MALSDGKIGEKYNIINLDLNIDIKRRLEILGMTNNTNIEILTKDKSSMIIKVRGNRFAISNLICKGIEVVKL